MIHFIIYDNNNQFKNKVTDTINKIMFEKNETYKIDSYNKFNKNILQERNKIYILDIDSLGENAILMAKKIRKKDWSSVIIFNTEFIDMWCYKILSLRLLVLDIVNHKTIKESILVAIKFILKYGKVIQIKSHNTIYKINSNDILYIISEKMQHRVSIVTNTKTISTNSTLTEIKSLLNDKFIYCHRSCLVNSDRIVTLNKSQRRIIFDNGTSLDLLSVRSVKNIETKISCNNL